MVPDLRGQFKIGFRGSGDTGFSNTAMITKYLNKSGKSGVKAYEILPTAIRVQFIKCGKWYSYSYTSAGMANVEQMKKLALSGFGLNSYIQRWVGPMYDK